MTYLYKSIDGQFYYTKPAALVGTRAIKCTRVKARFEKAFPNRFDWQCPVCGGWLRYWETFCPTCETPAE